MEMWVVSMEDFRNGFDLIKKTFKTKEEATEHASGILEKFSDQGYEQELVEGGSVIELVKGKKKITVAIYQTDSLEEAPEIVTSVYTYDERYYLEVTHNYRDKIASVYAYDTINPDVKPEILHHDLSQDDISDYELLSLILPDMDAILKDLQVLLE